jgi:hypothetical protein
MDVIEGLKGRFPRLQKIVADGGYRGELVEKVKKTWGDCPKTPLKLSFCYVMLNETKNILP